MDGDFVVVCSAPCRHCSEDHGVYTFGCKPIIFEPGAQFTKNKRPPTDEERENGVPWKEVQQSHA